MKDYFGFECDKIVPFSWFNVVKLDKDEFRERMGNKLFAKALLGEIDKCLGKAKHKQHGDIQQ